MNRDSSARKMHGLQHDEALWELAKLAQNRPARVLRPIPARIKAERPALLDRRRRLFEPTELLGADSLALVHVLGPEVARFRLSRGDRPSSGPGKASKQARGAHFTKEVQGLASTGFGGPLHS